MRTANTFAVKEDAVHFKIIVSLAHPGLVFQKDYLLRPTRKWRKLLNNGLVNDQTYYNLQNKRGYVVAYFSDLTCRIIEIILEDFVTLCPQQFISSFVVDICFNMYNKYTDIKSF